MSTCTDSSHNGHLITCESAWVVQYIPSVSQKWDPYRRQKDAVIILTTSYARTKPTTVVNARSHDVKGELTRNRSVARASWRVTCRIYGRSLAVVCAIFGFNKHPPKLASIIPIMRKNTSPRSLVVYAGQLNEDEKLMDHRNQSIGCQYDQRKC